MKRGKLVIELTYKGNIKEITEAVIDAIAYLDSVIHFSVDDGVMKRRVR